MKISIITVTYNSAQTLQDTINSVLGQTYPDIEYIIIDGKSTDGTVDIIKKNEPKFNGKMKWISESDNGIYDAMNKGIAMTTGDVIGILNSDDIYIYDNVISDIIAVFEKENVDSVYANLNFVSPQDANKIVRQWKSSVYKTGSFKKGWHPPHPAFFVKKECYKKYGLFDSSFKISADFELMLRFIEKNGISTYFFDKFIVSMRYGGESTGSLKKIIVGNKNVMKAFKKNNIPVSLFYPISRIIPKIKNKIYYKLKK